MAFLTLIIIITLVRGVVIKYISRSYIIIFIINLTIINKLVLVILKPF